MPQRPTTLETLMERISPAPNTGCWIWTGLLDPDGYGRVGYQYRNYRTHRLILLFLGIEIPEGMQIDHLCHDPKACSGGHCVHRSCCNPDHLKITTFEENWDRSNSLTMLHREKAHCFKGHAFTVENTYLRLGGGRRCRVCAKEKRAT